MNAKIVGESLKSYSDGFTVRRMTRDETKIPIDWFSIVKEYANDVEVAFDALGPELQAFVGVIGEKVVASVVHAPVSDNLLFGSMYYVEEKYRKKGLFTRVHDDTAIEYLKGRGLCIDSVSDENVMSMYKRRGFTEGFELIHYRGQVTEVVTGNLAENVKILPFTDSLFDQLMCYDDQCFVSPGSVQRRKLIELWVQIKGGLTMVAVENDGKGKVVGFVCRRPAVTAANNHIVGPLYADNYNIAVSLMSAVTEEISGHAIWMTVCVPCLEAVNLAEDFKLKQHFRLRRMYLNCQLSPPNNRVFAVTSVQSGAF